jgi:ABC-type oligopeptide transport system ATPase subunit
LVDLIEKFNNTQYFITFNNYHFAYVVKKVLNMYDGTFVDIPDYETYLELLYTNRDKLNKRRFKREK